MESCKAGSRETRTFVTIPAGILMLLGAAALIVFSIPAVRDTRVWRGGCAEGIVDPGEPPRITLWEQWKWERSIRNLILNMNEGNARQKAASVLRNACPDP